MRVEDNPIIREYGDTGALNKIETEDGGRYQIVNSKFYQEHRDGIISYIACIISDAWIKRLADYSGLDQIKKPVAGNPNWQYQEIHDRLHGLECNIYELIKAQLQKVSPQHLEGDEIKKTVLKSCMQAREEIRYSASVFPAIQAFLANEPDCTAIDRKRIEKHMESNSYLAAVCFKQIGWVGVEIYIATSGNQNIQTFGIINRYLDWQNNTNAIQHVFEDTGTFLQI